MSGGKTKKSGDRSHNPNPTFTTETRRHGVTEKNSGKKKVKSKTKIENPRTAENIEKSWVRVGNRGREDLGRF